jgi:hypothetical protein
MSQVVSGSKLGALTRWRPGQSVHALPQSHNVDLLCDCQGIIHFNAKIPNGAFDLFVTKTQLYRSQIARASIDQRRLGSAKRMSAKDVWI